MSDVGDCRSEIGVTVGLIDSIISVARVLRRRDFNATSIHEALLDLRSDEDVQFLLDRKSDSEQPEVREEFQNLKDVLYELLEAFSEFMIEFRYGTVVHTEKINQLIDNIVDLQQRL